MSSVLFTLKLRSMFARNPGVNLLAVLTCAVLATSSAMAQCGLIATRPGSLTPQCGGGSGRGGGGGGGGSPSGPGGS